MSKKKVGLVGARGYVGQELIPMVLAHQELELVFVSSRELDGQPLKNHYQDCDTELCFRNLGPVEVAESGADVVFLALPNGYAAEYVNQLEDKKPETLVIDLSADHRFDDSWVYGLVETNRDKIAGATRISNPGCYATAMQLAIHPFLDLLAAPPVCFGISGYSGAGTTPSPKNNPERLKDNILPYALANHIHEEEVSHQLGYPVHFSPHVASFFRGLTITTRLLFNEAQDYHALIQRLDKAYSGEALVKFISDVPEVRDNAGEHFAVIGGATLADKGKRLVLVSTIDNLLKGASTQAMQNLNVALGYKELTGIPVEGETS